MPCFNHARFLADSVRSIMEQTFRDLELIIVDDCSADNSWELMCNLARTDRRIKTIRHQTNLGASRSRNGGLRAAAGEFVAFCDSDDMWEPEKVASQVNMLRNNPQHEVAYCDSLIVDEEGRPTGELFSQRFPPPTPPSGWLFADLVRRNFINIQSVLMRADCVQHSGCFDEGIKWVEDWWFLIRASRDHRFLYMETPLARYRVHGKSTNVVRKYGYHVNRYKVFHRILKTYGDLPVSTKAEVLYKMGVDLRAIGKAHAGRRFLWNCVRLSMRDRRAFSTLWRAVARMMLKPRQELAFPCSR